MTSTTTLEAPVFKLREYQVEALAGFKKEWDSGIRATATVLPTGLGKTVIFSRMAADEIAAGGKVLILVHRDELVKQAVAKIQGTVPGVEVGVIKATRNDTSQAIIVASVLTLAKEKRLAQLRGVTLIIVDECHHAAAFSYQVIISHYAQARVAGFTATMDRQDSKKLGDVWQSIAYKRDVMYGILNGFLCDVEGLTVEVPDLDLSEVRTAHGDYVAEDLAEALEESEAGPFIAKTYLENAAGRRAVLFAPNVMTTELFAEAMNAAGVKTEIILGTTPEEERTEIYKRFEAGVTMCLANCMVLTEGWDAPWAEVAIVARPTKSQALYVQMVGRVLRPCPWTGKTKALVLDVVGAAKMHALATIANLVESKPEIQKGETLAEAVIREEAEKAPGRSTKKLILEKIDLFHRSKSAWLQTKSGVWFIPTRSSTWIIWPAADGTWGVFSRNKFRQTTKHMEGLAHDLAMAWCEQLADAEDPSVSSRAASWRKKGGKPSDPQRDLCAQLRIDITGLTKPQVSDLISIEFASRELPNPYPTFA